ncbi:Ap2-like ethylene-responsive transcription factor [Thalictrum thalictroides]|uniref:Ap2-like ethylene-responsive transcription factor n=1 Tax=Thalictrum thalictroides TaxID=46969 RepID=A0A7J6VSC4_THATH|nr:Ap2-like ethylene-responsive transcription factor [Thalictrum thalictroides]
MASSSSELKFKSESIAVEGEASETVIANDHLLIYRGLKKAKKERGCTAKERISKMPPCVAGKRSSIYRGVTRHRWTGRYEAHLWDKSTWNTNQNKKGKQVYLGAYDDEEAAARAYDLAALKYWGPGTLINFPVSDYSRDLEEMQNTSREDYLASLRRKSSGSSRGGIAKYRGLSRASQNSRWETSFSQIGMPEYLSSIRYGTAEGTSTESEYPGGFCIERKIDLTGYFKWWGPNKTRRTEKSFEETIGGQQDIGSELKALEWGVQPTEPYKMPSLGLSYEGKKHRGSALSALSILSRSSAYQSFKEKVWNEQDENDYSNENKNSVEMDYSKSIQIPCGDGGSERLGLLGMNWLPFQRSSCPLTEFISAPMLTPYNTVDPAADPILWTSLVSVPPPRRPVVTEVTKTESGTTYACYQQEER